MKKEIDDYEQRYNKANNEGAEYDFISVCREAALLGAKYGDEWANHKEVQKIIQPWAHICFVQ